MQHETRNQPVKINLKIIWLLERDMAKLFKGAFSGQMTKQFLKALELFSP